MVWGCPLVSEPTHGWDEVPAGMSKKTAVAEKLYLWELPGVPT